jgi:hypothetical protein
MMFDPMSGGFAYQMGQPMPTMNGFDQFQPQNAQFNGQAMMPA